MSTLVDEEIRRAPREKQEQLNKVIKDLRHINLSDSMLTLAEEYLKQGVVPDKFNFVRYSIVI